MVMNQRPKTREEFLESFPDKADKINSAFDEMQSASCTPCNATSLLHKLYIEVGLMVKFKNPVTPIDRNPLTPESMAQETENFYFVSMKSPRPPCEDCFKEHVATAIINLNESLIGEGYPKFRWLAIANLREASAEILGLNPQLAAEIRNIKLQMIKDKAFIPDLMQYL